MSPDADLREQWRPIETAPKDGTQVLLAAYFGGGVGWAIAAGGWSKHGWWSWMLDDDEVPTHWMPLPDPPVPAQT